MADYKGAALIFTFQDETGRDYVLLSQQDPGFRAHYQEEYGAQDMGPAMFPGGRIDYNELDRKGEKRRFAQWARAAFPRDNAKAAAAAAALRETCEETSIDVTLYFPQMQLCDAGTIERPNGVNGKVALFHIDAGVLSEAECEDLEKTLKPKDDTLTAALVPVDHIGSRINAQGEKSYHIKDYLLLRKMRQGHEPIEHEGWHSPSKEGHKKLSYVDQFRKRTGNPMAQITSHSLARYDVELMDSNAHVLDKILQDKGKSLEETPKSCAVGF